MAIETGTKPATEAPAKAARIQRSLGVLGKVNTLTGAALVAVNAIIAQTNHSHPAAKRASVTRSIPLWLGPAATTTAAIDRGLQAGADQAALDQAAQKRRPERFGLGLFGWIVEAPRRRPRPALHGS